MDRQKFSDEMWSFIFEHGLKGLILCDEELRFFANCDEIFTWKGSRVEKVTPERFEILKQSIADVDSIDAHTGVALYCARISGTRPQGAYYTLIKEKYWPLFDACGPAREISPSNPYRPGEYGRRSSKDAADSKMEQLEARIKELEEQLILEQQDRTNNFANVARLSAWMQRMGTCKETRANTMFTEGPERLLAYAIEDTVRKARSHHS